MEIVYESFITCFSLHVGRPVRCGRDTGTLRREFFLCSASNFITRILFVPSAVTWLVLMRPKLLSTSAHSVAGLTVIDSAAWWEALLDTRCSHLWLGSAPAGVRSRISADPNSLHMNPGPIRSLLKTKTKLEWKVVGRHMLCRCMTCFLYGEVWCLRWIQCGRLASGCLQAAVKTSVY